jgi:hypothetical protein
MGKVGLLAIAFVVGTKGMILPKVLGEKLVSTFSFFQK